MKKLLLLLMIVPMLGLGQCISGDCENGYGTYIYDNGDEYVGEFKDFKQHGEGTLTFDNGYRYVGEWKDNKMNGWGISMRADGTVVYEGLWEEGRFTFKKGTKRITK